MARTKGTYSLSANIEPRAAAPLDARTVVPTLADLTASGAFPYPYVGMIVSVQSEGKAYILTAADTTSSSNWMPVGSGSVIEDVTSLPTGSDIKNALYRTKTDSFSCYIYGTRFNQDKYIGYFVPYGFTYNIISDTKIEFYVPENTVTKYVSNESEMSFDTMEIVYPNEKGNIQVSLYENGVRVYVQSNADFYSFIIYRDMKLYAGDSTDETVMELAKKSDIQNIFIGTQAEWDVLTIDKKLTYKQVNITDDESDPSVVVDAVTDGDMHAVTSNAVYDKFKKVQPQTYECSGFLVNSLAGEITGYGHATVILRDGIAEIKFSVRIHTNDGPATFNWGLNRDLLHTLLPNLPVITPIGNYSNLQFFAGTGDVLIDLMGYGAMASSSNQFWVPARMYQIDGGTGIWGTDRFPINSYITGTVYGVYTI